MRDAILVLMLGDGENQALAFNAGLECLGLEKKAFDLRRPQPDWLEFEPEESWNALLEAGRAVLSRIGVDRVAGIAVVAQRDNVVLWDRQSGSPIYPAIGGMDRRADRMCRILKGNRKEPMLHYRTGLFLEPSFPAAKVAWILEQTPGAMDRARKGELAFGGMDAWILWKLTNGAVHATDPGNASRTLLFDLNTQHWEAQLLATFGIPAAVLPKVLPTSGRFGESDAQWFGQPLPVMAMAGDHQAGLFAQGIFQPDTIRVYYGTHLNMQTVLGTEPAVQTTLLTNVAWKFKNQVYFSLESSALTAGRAIDWLRDGLGIIASAEESETLARSVADTGGVYFVPAFNGLGAPFFDSHARGTVVGLNAETDRRHFVRAALEGIAHQVADVVRVIERHTQVALKALRVDGPAARNNFLMQFQADILGVPVERPVELHGAAQGAAALGAMAAGLISGTEQLAALRKTDRVFESMLPETARRQLRIRWQDAVERSRGWEHDT